jgi:hypothetical protein
MSVGYSTNLQLVEPVTGSEAGNWGYDINYGTTDYIDIAIAGTNNITTDADVTLTQTTGTSSGNNIVSTTAQYAQLLCTGSRTANRNINAPNVSKMYVVNNATTGGYTITIRGVTGPTTGVIVYSGETAIVFWSTVAGDFIKISSFGGTAALLLPVGTTAQEPSPSIEGMIRYNSTTKQFEGYSEVASTPGWYSVGGSSITNDTSSSTAYYPLFAHATSGTAQVVYTSNTQYTFKPSTGELKAPEIISTNGFTINGTTVSTSYTIATSTNAFSVGPITINSGVSVTLSSGQRWVTI